MSEVDIIKSDLECMLSERRYLHCLRVAEEAKKLASIYSCDEYRAYLAGLVHDIAKEFSYEDNKEAVLKYHLSFDLLEPDYKKILHSDIGSCLVRDKYGLDEEICHAIYSHTIGDIPMSLLDKIVFVADKIEPGKSYDGIELERQLAYKDIHAAVILCMENNHKKLRREKKKIYSKSLDVLKYLKENK